MSKPASSYLHIRAYHTLCADPEWKILHSQLQASNESAPIDAIFKNFHTGEWNRFSDITNEVLKEKITKLINTMVNALELIIEE